MHFATIDFTPQIASLPRRPGHHTLPQREKEESITLHYGGVTQHDRSEVAELATLLSYARNHLKRNWARRGRPPIYGDGPMYELAVLSSGTRVLLRRQPQQLWHCGNETGNATSIPVVVPLGRGQELTDPQRESLLTLFAELQQARGLPRHAVYGHNEWPRTSGDPSPSTMYRLLAGQSECPGPILHTHLVRWRATPADPTTADSPILGPSRATLQQAIAFMLARLHGEYSDEDIAEVILPAYWRLCQELGIVFEIAVAQLIHETGNLSAALAQRRDKDGEHLRNPAGIGVWERKELATPHKRPGTVFDADAGGYRPACQFTSWVDESIPAQLGRLLAYALPLDAPLSLAQEAVLRYALRVRPLPDHGRGTAPTLKALGKAHNPQGQRGIGWASPGTHYGEALARIANAIRSMPA